MIRFDGVTFSYADSSQLVLNNVNLQISDGEFCVVVGPTGSGKSTFLRAINGLVPHATGGNFAGDVTVEGRSTRVNPPRELADLVGFVGQNPAASFVTDVVEDELAYTMENLGVAPIVMRRRVEDTLDLLGLHGIRHRSLRTLSGGQQQRVAIGAVLTALPRVLVLDEPTSALDPVAAEEVLSTLARLVHDVGLSVLVAEHRLERVLPFCDRVILLGGNGGVVKSGLPSEIMLSSPVAPPLIELARVAHWDPLPMSIRDARRLSVGLRERLGKLDPQQFHRQRAATNVEVTFATLRRVSVTYENVEALRELDLELYGEVTAVMGRNGSGKSTLLNVLAGARRPVRGIALVAGADPSKLTPRQLISRVGLVPQDAQLLLYCDSVESECAAADKEGHLAVGTTIGLLQRLNSEMPMTQHPRDLSEGQRLTLALSVVLAHGASLILLDEPTRGLDYASKARLEVIIHELIGTGHSVVIATHDVEFVARVADRAIVLADGEIVGDGPAREVVCHSSAFSPQVAKVLAPQLWLTVNEVSAALGIGTERDPGDL